VETEATGAIGVQILSKSMTFMSPFNTGINLDQSQINTTKRNTNLSIINVFRLSGYFNENIYHKTKPLISYDLLLLMFMCSGSVLIRHIVSILNNIYYVLIMCHQSTFNKSSKPLLVLDCRHINPHLHKYIFNYKGDKVAREMFDIGDFIFSYDLKYLKYLSTSLKTFEQNNQR
jgi:hypothetical protein